MRIREKKKKKKGGGRGKKKEKLARFENAPQQQHQTKRVNTATNKRFCRFSSVVMQLVKVQCTDDGVE